MKFVTNDALRIAVWSDYGSRRWPTHVALMLAELARRREAIELGATGVTGWLVDQRFLVPGAQPHYVIAHVLDRLGALGG